MNSSKRKKHYFAFAAVIAVFMLTVASIGTSAYVKAVNIYDKIRVLNQIISIVNENYVESVNWDEALDGAFLGMLEELDPHSSYIPRDHLEGITEQYHGKFEGIGIEFDILGGYITVISPVVDSPSDRAGLQPGDKIVAIDGEDAYGITREEVFTTLRGPKGSPVIITIKSTGVEKPFEVESIRDQIPWKYLLLLLHLLCSQERRECPVFGHLWHHLLLIVDYLHIRQ